MNYAMLMVSIFGTFCALDNYNTMTLQNMDSMRLFAIALLAANLTNVIFWTLKILNNLTKK